MGPIYMLALRPGTQPSTTRCEKPDFDQSVVTSPAPVRASREPWRTGSPTQPCYRRSKPLPFVWASVLGLLLGAGASNSRCFADWPEFRGPLQNGIVSNPELPIAWSAEPGQEKNIVWFAPVRGLGWSSPVIIGDRIYMTSACTNDSAETNSDVAQSLVLVCIDGKSGKTQFEKTIFEQGAKAPSIHNKNSHASPTPIAMGNRLFLHFGHQGTACTDLEGTVIWKNRDHSYAPVHGNGGSPILAGNLLVFTCDGADASYTVALDQTTGGEVWRTPRGIECERPFSFATPQYIEVDGKPQIISPGSNIVQSLDPETGLVLWSVRYEGFSLIPRPLFHQGLVYLSTGYMAPKLLAIDPTGTGDVTDSHVRWTLSGGIPNTPSFAPVGDQLVMVSDGGIATGVRAVDGKKLWQKRIGGNYSASPTTNGNLVFLQSESGEAIVLKIDEQPEELSRNQLPGRAFASYATIDNDWIIRTEGGLYRIGSR
ncbi:MAG: PQQ-binding-like beta-propeller repeat protein [Pirellula sp.]